MQIEKDGTTQEMVKSFLIAVTELAFAIHVRFYYLRFIINKDRSFCIRFIISKNVHNARI